MPSGRGSGSHGGGSRSSGSRSGGSHFSSSSRSRSSSGSLSSSTRHYSTGTYYSIGSTTHYSSYGHTPMNARGVGIFFISFFLIISFVFFVMTFGFIDDKRDRLDVIKNDRDYYLNIIETGRKDTRAKVTSINYNAMFDKYYIEYSFQNGSGELHGYSFCMYDTYDEAPDIYYQTNYIVVCYDTLTPDADSIPLDYKDFQLEDDGEYVYYKKALKSNEMLRVIMGIVSGVFFVITIMLVLSKKKKTETTQVEVENPTSAIPVAPSSICSYCGATIEKDAVRCQNCGASMPDRG